MKILVMADCHIKARTWTNSMLLAGDAYAGLEKLKSLLDRMGKNAPDICCICGDWFDSNRPSSVDVVESVRFLRRFRHVYYVRGNHDNAEVSFLSFLDNFTAVADGQVVDIEGTDISIGGVNWCSDAGRMKDVLISNYKNYPEGRKLYVMMHLGIKELLGYDGAYDLEKKDLVEIFPVRNDVNFLVGHVHTRSTVAYNGAGAWFHSPGSLYPLSSDKMQEPCDVSILDTDTSVIRNIPVNVRNYYSLDYTGMADLEAVLDGIAQDEEKYRLPLPAYVRINLDGRTDYVKPKDTGLVLHAVNASPETVDVEQASEVVNMTLEEAVKEECDDDDLKDMACALLASDDPVAEIEKWFNVWKVERL